MSRRTKLYLEDIIDKMIQELYDARRVCHSPGDNFAIDQFLEIREGARRAVRISRSRIFAAKRGGYLPGNKSSIKTKPVFTQSEFYGW